MAKAMVSIHEKGIFIRYEDEDGTIGHWCSLVEFFEQIIGVEIMPYKDNGPNLTFKGKLCVDWVSLLSERNKGKNKFKYKIADNEYMHIWY